jgi:hypothetical protein
MKNWIITVVIGLVIGIASFFTGRQVGIISTETRYENRDMEDLLNDLKIRESEDYLKYIKVQGHIARKNIGSLFRPEYANVYKGIITNNALFIQIKDVQLKIDFLSATGTLLSSDTITVYEFVEPHCQTDFQERISVPYNQVKSFAHVISAKIK